MLELQRWLYGGATAQLKTFTNAIEPLTLLAGVGIAAIFGFVHAFMPGHGKTVLMSYFLGCPGKPITGLTTSIILVLTHVGSAVLMVLAGFIVIRRTIGGAGRAPVFETASAVFIVLIGIWLLYNAVRHRHDDSNLKNGAMLAVATGLVPCPLTTFIMVYHCGRLAAHRQHGIGNGRHNRPICDRYCFIPSTHSALLGKDDGCARAGRANIRIHQRGRNHWIRSMGAR